VTPRCEIAVQDAVGLDPDLRSEIEAWLERAVPGWAPAASSFGVRFASTAEVREVNARLRGRDRDTDVLSFAGEAGPEGLHLGDVLVAVPVAEAQAREAGHDLARELKELLLHGALHCLGHDHATDGGEMAGLELELRQRWIGDG
jgi:probable rRNA maturation factor